MGGEIYFLKDTEIDEYLISGFTSSKYPIHIIGTKNSSQYLTSYRIVRIVLMHWRYIKVSFNALFRSNKTDVIICFLDVMALYLYILSKLFGRSRCIIAVNIMYNDNSDFITRSKKKLFRVMLKSKYIYPTVTSIGLMEYYKNTFDLPQKDFFLVHDCYGKYIELKKDYQTGNGYVFCGGANSRDWKTLVNAAKLLPNIRFVIVGPTKNTLGNNLPLNIEYYYNIEYSKFNDLMGNSSLLALPLSTEAPAGLVVLISAGLMTKAVITTDNVTMREYITHNENGILVSIGDSVNFARQIELLIDDVDKQKLYGQRLHQQIEKLSSPEVFANEIFKIVNQIHTNENSINK